MLPVRAFRSIERPSTCGAPLSVVLGPQYRLRMQKRPSKVTGSGVRFRTVIQYVAYSALARSTWATYHAQLRRTGARGWSASPSRSTCHVAGQSEGEPALLLVGGERPDPLHARTGAASSSRRPGSPTRRGCASLREARGSAGGRRGRRCRQFGRRWRTSPTSHRRRRLVDAEVGRRPRRGCALPASTSTALIGRLGSPGVQSFQFAPPSSERKTRAPPIGGAGGPDPVAVVRSRRTGRSPRR